MLRNAMSGFHQHPVAFQGMSSEELEKECLVEIQAHLLQIRKLT